MVATTQLRVFTMNTNTYNLEQDFAEYLTDLANLDHAALRVPQPVPAIDAELTEYFGGEA
jgi:hypothetical protein